MMSFSYHVFPISLLLSLLSPSLPFPSPHLHYPSPPTGSGESGKSTIVKQMKIIHQNGYTPAELMLFRPTIYRNLIESAQNLVGAMRKLGVECEMGNRVS